MLQVGIQHQAVSLLVLPVRRNGTLPMNFQEGLGGNVKEVSVRKTERGREGKRGTETSFLKARICFRTEV